jgi:hypothetical protein
MIRHPDHVAWEAKCRANREADATAFAKDGIPFGHPACRFYKGGGGRPVRFGRGMTQQEWEAGPARSSALRAADLPED